MTLKTLMAGHMTSVMLRTDHFAADAVYTPPGEDGVALRGAFGDLRTTEVQLPSGQWIKQRVVSATFNRDPAAASGGIASPQLKATVARGGEIWAVEEIESQDDCAVTLRLAFKGLMEQTGPRFLNR